MKRYMGIAGSALAVVAFVTLAAILITLFQRQQTSPQPLSQIFQSPIGTPTPTPASQPGVWQAANVRVIQQRQLTTDGSVIGPPLWKPGSTELAYNLLRIEDEGKPVPMQPFVISVTGTDARPIETDVDASAVRFLQWSPDSGGFLYIAEDETSSNDYEIHWRSQQGTDNIIATTSYPLAFDLPGQRIVWFDADARLIFSNRTGKPLGKPVELSGIVDALKYPLDRMISLSPTGSKIVYRSEQSTVLHIVDLLSETAHTITVDPVNKEEPAFGLAVWSPNGQRIAYLANWGPLPSLWVMNVDGSDRRQIVDWPRERPGLFQDLVWSTDGRVLFFTHRPTGIWPSGGGYQVYAVNRDGTELQTLGLDDLYGGYLSMSSSGRYVAFERSIASEKTESDQPYRIQLWVAELSLVQHTGADPSLAHL